MESTTPFNPFETTNPLLAGLHREADAIQSYMDRPATLQDPASLTYRLNDMDVYMARLSDMLIRAKALRDRAQNSFLEANEDKLSKMKATASNRLINAYLYEYKIAYDRLETMYHTLEVLARNLVTQISYIKEQMRNGL